MEDATVKVPQDRHHRPAALSGDQLEMHGSVRERRTRLPSPLWGEGPGVRGGPTAEDWPAEPGRIVPGGPNPTDWLSGTAPHPQPLSPKGRGEPRAIADADLSLWARRRRRFLRLDWRFRLRLFDLAGNHRLDAHVVEIDRAQSRSAPASRRSARSRARGGRA